MARSKSGGTRSYIRGKIGADVYCVGKTGKGDRQQVVRSLAEQVANPQTSPQMVQRMLMSSVAQLTRALKPIIDHSFDGIPAGQPSISHFRQLALNAYKVDSEKANPEFGYVDWQGKLIPNCIVPISRGKAIIPAAIKLGLGSQYLSSYPSMGVELQASNPGLGNQPYVYDWLDTMFGQHKDVQLTVVTLNTDNISNPTQAKVIIGDYKIKENLTNFQMGPNFQTETSVFDISAPWLTSDDLYCGVDSNGVAGFKCRLMINVDPDGSGGKLKDDCQYCVGGAFIVSKKVNGKWIHSNSDFTLVGWDDMESANPDTQCNPFPMTESQAIATYPVGSARFLNGGDI